MRWLRRFRPRRMGLRARITLIFALGALVLSALLAIVTYGLVRSTLLRQRENLVTTQAVQNAATVGDALESAEPDVQGILGSLRLTTGSNPVVRYQGSWSARNAEFGPDALDPALQARVIGELTTARMRYGLSGEPVLAVGVPLPAVQASYFEITDLSELAGTLRSVGYSLLGAAAITTALGVALGYWASGRAVKPLVGAAQAAKAIAGGSLDTRLDPGDDRDLQALASAFNDMASALQARVERDARFASDVSHELRSPLMTLSASIEVLQARREEMPERAQAALDLLVADVARFRSLVEDLLEISRYDAGAVRLHLEELLVAEFVRQAVAVSTLPATPVKVDEVAEGLVIQADKRRLARVLANLLDNARLHGGGEADVLVEHDAEEAPVHGHVRIIVADHGAGVPPEERQLVFERFSRGTQAGRRGVSEGAGLGLALVDEHVRLLGGLVWVEDRPDGEPGARFVIELPAEPA